MGPVNKKGYGKIYWNGRIEYVHRVVYGAVEGNPICVLHRCDNPRCVNPYHLFAGTVYDNNEDMRLKGRAGNGGSYLTVDDVFFIREHCQRGQGRRIPDYGKVPLAVMAEWFGLHPQTIGFILRGDTWNR